MRNGRENHHHHHLSQAYELFKGILLKRGWQLISSRHWSPCYAYSSKKYITWTLFVNCSPSTPGCAGDDQEPDEHGVRRARLAPRHHPRLRRPRQCTLLQNAQSDLLAWLQRHLPVPGPPALLFPWIHGHGRRGQPRAAGPPVQVRGWLNVTC